LSSPRLRHPFGLLRHRDILHPGRRIGAHRRHSTTVRKWSVSPTHGHIGV
jgi:hypothetical protein